MISENDRTSLPGGDIDAALEDCIAQAQGEGISLQDAMQKLGPASFCFVSLLLSIPFLQPISLGPLNMASGVTFMAAGWQLAKGRSLTTLPKAMKDARIHGKGWLMVLGFCQKILRQCRKFTRVRRESWVTGPYGNKVVGWSIFTGGLLLAIPFANLPLNNTFPALMILFACIAWLERDGLMIFISFFWCAVSVLYFVIVGVALWFFGAQIWGWLGGLWK